MPTKVLAWNIQNFTIRKIDPVGGGNTVVQIGPMTFRFPRVNSLRLNYILDNVARTDPDVFTVIEVISSWGPRGSLVSGNGALGVLELLAQLRILDANWCLVPPQKLTNFIEVNEQDDGHEELVRDGGYTEAIGVFFRADRLTFIGPYIWPLAGDNNNPNKIAVANAGGAVAGAYPANWAGCLPAGNYYAGQSYFQTTAVPAREIFFPGQNSRRPFLTRFQEIGGNHRIITLVSVHYPPRQPEAISAWTNTLGYFIDSYVHLANEVICIAGDFNINYRGDEYIPNEFFAGYYGYHTIINGAGYFPTIYHRAANATPTEYMKLQGLDNATVHYQPAAYEGASTFRMIDRVANDLPANLPSLLYNPMAEIMNQPTPAAQNDLFRRVINFGRLGPVPGTSDHLAILYTI